MLQNRIAIRNRILKWFDQRDRPLPWLVNRTPYRIWVSEIMLQQTQISTVIEYYKRFIKRFPNVKKLASANEQEVLSLWEGLGYYRRARQMHRAAQIVMEEHRGQFPIDFEDVLALPGIGRYTAGAILSISLDQKLPILEGNTIRLFSRWIGWSKDVGSTESQNELWAVSQSLLPAKRVGDLNQALMDFGREVCQPKNPKCDSCCVSEFCRAMIQGSQQEIPFKAAKMVYQDVNESIVLVRRRSKVLMRQCQDGERWAGLWDFPRFAGERSQKIENTVFEETGLMAQLGNLNHTIKHAVTRFRIKLDCYEAESVTGRLRRDSKYVWKSIAELDELPLSVTGRKFARKFL